MDLERLPKVELHRHLEGSLRLETAFSLAGELGLAVPARSPRDLQRSCQVLAPLDNLDQVLRVFDFIAQLFGSVAIVERLAYEAVVDAARDNIRLLELRFSPDYMARARGLDWDGMTEALVRGVSHAEADTGIVVGLIAIVSRNLGLESARATVDYAARWRHALVGFDLADDEIRWPSRLFREALAPLKALGLPLTVHSGEATGPGFVLDTLDSLQPQRLGHGVAVAADPDLMARVRQEKIAIEVCPSSNVRTRAVASFVAHPAAIFLREGLRVTLNTDDPGLFDLSLTGELELAREHMGLTDDDIRLTQRTALEASFVPEVKKAALRPLL